MAKKLDNRREKLQIARASADAAAKSVENVDTQLRANAAQASELEAKLAAARDQVALLRKSIKANKKERDKLRGARKQARVRSAKTAQRASEVERRYDKAMLAEIVRREKQQDLTQHAVTGAPAPAQATPAAAAPATAAPAAAAPAAAKTTAPAAATPAAKTAATTAPATKTAATVKAPPAANAAASTRRRATTANRRGTASTTTTSSES